MLPIQYILCFALLFLILIIILRLRSYKVNRFIIVLIIMTGMVFVIFPSLTTDIANLIGVGRGADLLLYFSLIGFSFVIIIIYSKQRKLERLLTELLRKNAIQGVREPASNTNDSNVEENSQDENESYN